MMETRGYLAPSEWRSYYYRPSCLKSGSRITSLRTKRRYAIKHIDLGLTDPTDAEQGLSLTLYEPLAHGRFPTILVNPIFRGTRLAQIFARYFARKGWNAAVIHHERLNYDFGRGHDQIEVYLRKAVARNLHSLDWIMTHDKTDPARIGTFGISFGAIIGTIVAAVDKRPRCHVFALAGAPLADVITKTRNRTIRRLIREESRRQEKSTDELRLDILRHIRTEPLAFAPHIASDQVAMYISLFDRVVSLTDARRLWRAMGKPKAFYVPFGHYSSILSFPYAERLAYRFFKEKLSPSI